MSIDTSEATLEARWHALLAQLFQQPLRATLTHQATFTVRLGLTTTSIDGEAAKKLGGRLDMLLSAPGIPIALVELKKENAQLTPNDEEQLLSYAKISQPMPPICVLSNSKETRVFYTYNGKPIGLANEDESTLQAKLEAVAGAAAADAASAVRFLLGKSPEVFRALFATLTEAELGRLTGPIENLRRPLAAGFRFRRTATESIVSALRGNKPVVLLIGRALTGKTNIAATVCEAVKADTPRFVPIYTACDNHAAGLLQSLANRVTASEKIGATPDDVRDWLYAGKARSAEERPVIVLDSWPNSNESVWRAELDELVQHASADTYSLLLVLDEEQARSLLVNAGRGQPTPLASKATRVVLEGALDDDECESASSRLYKLKQLTLSPGVLHERLFRVPHTWRMLAARAGKGPGAIPSVLGIEQLGLARQLMAPGAAELDAMRRYVERALAESPHASRAVRELLLGSPGWLALVSAEESVGAEQLRRLQEAGLVRVRQGPDHHAVVSPQVPTFLASLAVASIRNRLGQQLKAVGIVAATDGLLSDCLRFPYPELVGAAAVIELGADDAREVVDELARREPAETVISADCDYALLRQGDEALTIPPEIIEASIEDGARVLHGSPLAQLIAAHVLYNTTLSNDAIESPLPELLVTLASARHPVLPIDMSFAQPLPIQVIALPDGASILDEANGIIEPITAVLEFVALDAPAVFDVLIESAMKSESTPLLSRVTLAALAAAHRGAEVAARSFERLYSELQRRLKHYGKVGRESSGGQGSNG